MTDLIAEQNAVKEQDADIHMAITSDKLPSHVEVSTSQIERFRLFGSDITLIVNELHYLI